MAVRAENTGCGLEIPLAAFRARLGNETAFRRLLRALTVTERPQPGRPRCMANTSRYAYEIIDHKLIVPRINGAKFIQARIVDAILDSAAPDICTIDASRTVADSILYEYQEAATEFLTHHFASNNYAYLQMDTGLGKSRVGCAVIAALAKVALVVVPTDAIATQWVEEFAEIFPNMRVDVYHNATGRSKKVPPSPQTHDVVIIIINTFRSKTPEFMKGFGTMVIDEAHEYHSAHSCKALWLSQSVQSVLGLSATPLERPDGLDRYITLHLGPVIYPRDIPGFDVNAVKFRGEVRTIEYSGHPDHCESAVTPAGTMSAIMTVGNILRDQSRLALIATEVSRLHAAGHGVFVFAEMRDALPAIKHHLELKLGEGTVLAPELPISILRGGVRTSAVRDARDAGAHVVLTTYGFSRRGISLPDMTAIVLATPRRNGSRQILGRILRRGSDESIVRQIVDIVDIRTGLRSQYAARKKVYIEKNYPITRVTAAWNDTDSDSTPRDVPQDDLSELTVDELLALVL